MIASQLLGQSFFEADDKKIKTGTISRIYNFSYSFGDTLTIFFDDSILQYSNTNQTIVKKISYSNYNEKSKPSTQIEYLGINGRDSISKHYNDGKPSKIYQTRYDNIGRIIYYGMKDLNADSTSDHSFELFYEYRDSSISTGKIEIQTIFVDDAFGDKRYHFRVLNEYDNKNRKVKEVRESEANDPMAQITIYTYNNKDSLISEKVDGVETLSAQEKHINTKCNIESEYSFVATDYNSIQQLIYQLLIENKKLLTNNQCENYFLTLISYNKQTRLTIEKRQPYWCGGRKVVFITKTPL